MKPFSLKLLLMTPLILQAEPRQIFPDDTDKWQMAGPGEFQVENDIATAKGGMGLWWYTHKQFRSSTLSLEFKMEDSSHNSGVFVRFPDPEDDPWIAVREGYEIQICGRDINKNATGAIYDIQPPVAIPLKEDGEWNTMKIHTLTHGDDIIAVELNGELVNLFTPQEGRGEKKGYYGIQNHDDNSPVQFRNITVTEHKSSSELEDVLTPEQISAYQTKREQQSGEE